MASRGKPEPRQGISAILNNIQVIKDQFRKQEKRIDLFDQKLKKSHRSFGNEIFKVRNEEYFDHQKQHRYKTPFLKLREIHRSLRGMISRAQKQKDKHDLLNPPSLGPYLPTYNDIKNYPDTREPLQPEQMIENVNKMINEEAKYHDEEWHNKEKSVSSNDSDKAEQTIFKKEAKSNHKFKFTLADKLQSAFQEKFQKIIEQEELEKLKMQHLHVHDMITRDVNDLYSHQEFKEVMSENFPGSLLNEVATRLMQQFKSQLKVGVQRPVPNLSMNSKSIRADCKEMSELFESLLFTLRSSNREQYMALRDGKLSLNQLCRTLCEQKCGLTFTVMDDIIDQGKQLKQPSKHAVAACNQLSIEAQLLKHAEKRGVDKKLLKETAPKLTLEAKCIRSIYSKPARRRPEQKVDHQDKTLHVHQTKEAQDKARREELIQRQEEKWQNFDQKNKFMTEQDAKLGKKKRYEIAKSIESRFSSKLPQHLHEGLIKDYKNEYSKQFKVKKERVAALRPWRTKQFCSETDVLKSQTIKENITYEQIPDSFKEKLENCQEALFLKRIYEDTEGCVLEMPIRFAFTAEKKPQTHVQTIQQPQIDVAKIRNPSEVKLDDQSPKQVKQINQVSGKKQLRCHKLQEEDFSQQGPDVDGTQTVEASIDSFSKFQNKNDGLSPPNLVRVEANLKTKLTKTAVILKVKGENSSSTEEEIIQSSKHLKSNSIVKQLLEFENHDYSTERFRPKSAVCPTSSAHQNRLYVTRRTELQCNNFADLKVNEDHQQFLLANMRKGAHSGCMISNSSKNPTPKQAAESIVPSRHIVLQGQMMKKHRPSTIRPKTGLNSMRPHTVLESTIRSRLESTLIPHTVFNRTKPGSTARMSTNGRNTPNATSSIKDYELKTSQVPSSVFDWYNKNIVRSHEQRSPAAVQQKQVAIKTAATKKVRLTSAKNGDLQKTLGTQDSNVSFDHSSAPFVKGFVIKNSETISVKEQELISGSAAVAANQGFNWLTGAKMTFRKNTNIPSRFKVTEPILKNKKKQISELSDFVDYPVAKEFHLFQIDQADLKTELKDKSSLNLISQEQSVLDLI